MERIRKANGNSFGAVIDPLGRPQGPRILDVMRMPRGR